MPILSIEIAPASRLQRDAGAPAYEARPPKCAIVDFAMDDHGNLKAQGMDWSEWLPLREFAGGKGRKGDVPRAEYQDRNTGPCPWQDLGIRIKRSTLIRLAWNGYIRARRPSAQTWEIHLGSLRAHLKRVEADLAFWSRRSIPDGWTADGQVIWRDVPMARSVAWQSTANLRDNDLAAAFADAPPLLPRGVRRVKRRRTDEPGRIRLHVDPDQYDLFSGLIAAGQARVETVL